VEGEGVGMVGGPGERGGEGVRENGEGDGEGVEGGRGMKEERGAWVGGRS